MIKPIHAVVVQQLLKEKIDRPDREDADTYVLYSVNLNRSLGKFTTTNPSLSRTVTSWPNMDSQCDKVCDGIVCDAVCDSICDGITGPCDAVCDGICDGVMCDAISCDNNVCDSICDGVCDKICDGIM